MASICFVSRRFFPTISGMSVYAMNLLRELVALGHQVTMISQYRGDETGTKIYGGGPPPPVPGVKVIGLESVGEQNGGDFEKDIEIMVETINHENGKRRFDLLHAQYGYPTGFAVLRAARLLGLPNVVSIQGGDGHWVGTCCRTHQLAMRAVLDHTGALLIGSKSFAAEVAHNHGTSLERFTLVPGAVDTDRFRPRPDWKAGEWVQADHPTLLYHGRVDRRKGALDLVEAFHAVRSDTNASLIISGIGPDSEPVKVLVAEYDLADRIEITGYCSYEETPQVYHRGDIFLSPTYAEGFSNTILEAMASGLPVISTNSVGVVDCIRPDENGLLTNPGDIPALGEAILRLVRDRSLQAELSEAALHEVRKVYSWPVIGRQIAEVYQDLIGTKPDTEWDDQISIEPCRFRETPHLL